MKGKKSMLNDTQEVRTIPESPEKRGAWYLLTGVILGLILGLVYAWVVNPVVYEDASPANLGQEEKDAYRAMIAQVYAATSNFERASLRLAVLEDEDPVYTLGGQAQRALAEGKQEEAWVLALLASAIQTSLESSAGESPLDIVPTQTLPALNSYP